jgi:hypothetical protein
MVDNAASSSRARIFETISREADLQRRNLVLLTVIVVFDVGEGVQARRRCSGASLIRLGGIMLALSPQADRLTDPPTSHFSTCFDAPYLSPSRLDWSAHHRERMLCSACDSGIAQLRLAEEMTPASSTSQVLHNASCHHQVYCDAPLDNWAKLTMVRKVRIRAYPCCSGAFRTYIRCSYVSECAFNPLRADNYVGQAFMKMRGREINSSHM